MRPASPGYDGGESLQSQESGDVPTYNRFVETLSEAESQCGEPRH